MQIIKSLSIFIFLILFTSSCVYDKEFAYLNDQIVSLNKRVTDLQEYIDRKLASKAESEDMQPLNKNLAEIRIEIDKLKENIGQLSGRIEDNEHIISRAVEKDLSDQDTIKSEMTKLSELAPKIRELEGMVKYQMEYLNLEPATIIQDSTSMAKGDAGQTEKAGVPSDRTLVSKDADLYDESLSLFKAEKYERAIDGFQRFLIEFPKSDLADNAQFWIGECYMALKQYEKAILEYQKVIKNYPDGNKVPNAMLRQAVGWLEINDKVSAKIILQTITKKYPDSSEAKIAQTRLKSIE